MNFCPIQPEDRDWVRDILVEHWAGPEVASRGKLHEASQLPGFIARTENPLQLRSGQVIPPGKPVGVITYAIENNECEVVTIDSLYEGVQIGSGLLLAVRKAAEAAGCKRIWMVTSNDNTHAMHFYQRRGFRMAAVHRNAIDEARATLKPGIPLNGMDNIPIHDEVEFELLLT